jgi:ABC-type transport system involved in cytochrome c biogenesis permease subunit
MAEWAFVSSDVALGLAQRLWLYPTRWGALVAGYGAFAVAGLGALSAAGQGQRRGDLGRFVNGATVVGVLALGAGVLLEATWSWLVWGSLWSGHPQLTWNIALVACGAATVHAWRRGSRPGAQIGLALTGLVLAVVALFSGARLA